MHRRITHDRPGKVDARRPFYIFWEVLPFEGKRRSMKQQMDNGLKTRVLILVVAMLSLIISACGAQPSAPAEARELTLLNS